MEPTLKLLRVNKGFNQDELGEKIGVSQTTISAWEQGKAKPSAKNIYKLAKIYAVEPTVIFNTIFKQKLNKISRVIQFLIKFNDKRKGLNTMNELKILGTEKIGSFEFTGIEGGFGKNKKAMLVRDIAVIHGKEVRQINQAINMNRKRFKDGIDVIDFLNQSNGFRKFAEDNGLIGSNRTQHVYLLSERGYAKLLKILEDDKAWEIYDELVDNYFNMRYVIQKQDSYMITDPVQRAKRWIEEQEEHQVKLAMAKQETKDVQDNTPISSKDYQVLSRKIGQKLDRYLSQHQIYNKNQVSLLRWDLNNAILKAAGVPARTLIKQKHFTAIAEALVNWEPSESTLEKMKAY